MSAVQRILRSSVRIPTGIPHCIPASVLRPAVAPSLGLFSPFLQQRGFSFSNHFDVQRVISNQDNKSFAFHRDVGDLRAETIKKAEKRYGKVIPGQGVAGGYAGQERQSILGKLGSGIGKQIPVGYNPQRGSAKGWTTDTRGVKVIQGVFNVKSSDGIQMGYGSSLRMLLITMFILVGGAFGTVFFVAQVGVTDVVDHVRRLNEEVEREMQLSATEETQAEYKKMAEQIAGSAGQYKDIKHSAKLTV